MASSSQNGQLPQLTATTRSVQQETVNIRRADLLAVQSNHMHGMMQAHTLIHKAEEGSVMVVLWRPKSLHK